MYLIVQRQRTTLNILRQAKIVDNQQSFLEAIAVVPNKNKRYVI